MPVIRNCNLPVNTIIGGKYKITALCSKPGGYGITYTVITEDAGPELSLAIKEYYPVDKLSDSRSDTQVKLKNSNASAQAQWESSIETYIRHCRSLIAYSGTHPRIHSFPKYYDIFTENNTAYLVMSALNGNPLWQSDYSHENLNWLKNMTDSEILSLFIPLIRDLDELHKAGIIHCDISPSNILFDNSTGTPQLFLVDFGSAIIRDAEVLHPVNWQEKYSAPELILCPNLSVHPDPATRIQDCTKDILSCDRHEYELCTKRISSASDIYSLCAVMYFCFMNAHLLHDGAAKVQDIKFTEPWVNHNDDLPQLTRYGVCEEISSFIKKGMSYAPRDRYRSMLEMLEEIYRVKHRLATDDSPYQSRLLSQASSRYLHSLLNEILQTIEPDFISSYIPTKVVRSKDSSSLSCPKARLVTICGTAGCGKTTFMKMLILTAIFNHIQYQTPNTYIPGEMRFLSEPKIKEVIAEANLLDHPDMLPVIISARQHESHILENSRFHQKSILNYAWCNEADDFEDFIYSAHEDGKLVFFFDKEYSCNADFLSAVVLPAVYFQYPNAMYVFECNKGTIIIEDADKRLPDIVIGNNLSISPIDIAFATDLIKSNQRLTPMAKEIWLSSVYFKDILTNPSYLKALISWRKDPYSVHNEGLLNYIEHTVTTLMSKKGIGKDDIDLVEKLIGFLACHYIFGPRMQPEHLVRYVNSIFCAPTVSNIIGLPNSSWLYQLFYKLFDRFMVNFDRISMYNTMLPLLGTRVFLLFFTAKFLAKALHIMRQTPSDTETPALDDSNKFKQLILYFTKDISEYKQSKEIPNPEQIHFDELSVQALVFTYYCADYYYTSIDVTAGSTIKRFIQSTYPYLTIESRDLLKMYFITSDEENHWLFMQPSPFSSLDDFIS